MAGKPNNYQLYLHYLIKFCDNISYKLIPRKIYGNSGMAHIADINQAPSPYSMLQHIGRVATPKIVLRHCLRYLQTTLIMGGWELVSEFMYCSSIVFYCSIVL